MSALKHAIAAAVAISAGVALAIAPVALLWNAAHAAGGYDNIIGAFESAAFVPGKGVVLTGWAIDTDHPSQPVMFLDRTETVGGRTYDHAQEYYHIDVPRPDVAKAHPGAGPDHGFSLVVGFGAPGADKLCLSAVGVGGALYDGADHDQYFQKPLGCHTLTIPKEVGSGALEHLGPNPSGPGLVYSGWAASNYGLPSSVGGGYEIDPTLTITPDDGSAPIVESPDDSTAATVRTGVSAPAAIARGFSDVVPLDDQPVGVAGTYKLCVAMWSVIDPPASYPIGCKSVHLLAFTATLTTAHSFSAELGAKNTAPAYRYTPAPDASGVQWAKGGKITSRASTLTVTAPYVGHDLSATVWAAKAGYLSANEPIAGLTIVTIPGVSVSRAAGADRFGTAVAVSRREFPNSTSGAPVVYLASGIGFADALSAGPAAAVSGGPLLLTQRATLPANVIAELKRLHPHRIVIVGGTAAVAPAVASAAAKIAPVKRIAGADRYATSRAVAAYAFPKGAAGAYVASGASFPDALSAGAAAGHAKEPVLLTTPTMSSAVSALTTELRHLGAKKTTIVGGTSAIASSVQSAIGKVGAVTRLAGADRDATSQAIAASAFSAAPTVYLASDRNFPDGLAGSAAAGRDGGPLLVFAGGCVTTAIIERIAALHATHVVEVGGTSVIGELVDRLYAC